MLGRVERRWFVVRLDVSVVKSTMRKQVFDEIGLRLRIEISQLSPVHSATLTDVVRGNRLTRTT